MVKIYVGGERRTDYRTNGVRWTTMAETENLRTRLRSLMEERDMESMTMDAVADHLGVDPDAVRAVTETEESPFGDEVVYMPSAPEEEREGPAAGGEGALGKEQGYNGDVADLHAEPGEETGETYYNLPVREDNGHPLIPADKPYYAREVGNTGRTDLEVLTHRLADPDYADLIIGHAGTGKNAAINKIAAQTNNPVVRIPVSQDITYEDVVGSYAPSEDGSGFEFKYGVLAAAFTRGWWVVVDEINAMPPEISTALHQATEENGEARLLIRETQEELEPHPNFRFIATMNPDYAGTKRLNMAFASRFRHLKFEYLPPEAEQKVITDKTTLSDADARKLTRLAAGLRDRLESGDLETPVTPRHLIQIGRDADLLGLKGATKELLLPYADPNDRDVIDSVIDKHL